MVVIGERVMTNWALSGVEHSRLGVAVSMSPSGAFVKVSWNDGATQVIARNKLLRVSDDYRR